MLVLPTSPIMTIPQRRARVAVTSTGARPTRQTRIFASLIRDTQAAIKQCGYARVYFALACEVFPDVEDQRPQGFPSVVRDIPAEDVCMRLCHGLLYDYLDAIDEFGYEAVYFGVGCVAFPHAVDPWAGNDY